LESETEDQMAERHYLDWNATAPLRPSARAAMLAAFDVVGNPSSVHREGRLSRGLMEQARAQVAALAGADPRNVLFTSGGTESNMLALTPALQVGDDRRPRDRLLVSAIEHVSVLAGGRFPVAAIGKVRVTGDGVVDLEHLQAELDVAVGRGERVLVSIMLANNETGVIQPVRDVAERVHAAGGILHVDAVHGYGKIPCDINELEADLLSVSAHKIGGPQGVGALVRRDQALHFLEPLLKGGGQERGMRAGTEDVAGIAGLGAAAAAAAREFGTEAERLPALRARIEAGLRAIAPDTVVFGAAAARVPNTVLYAVPGIRAETALIALDLEGIAASSGAACSSGKVAPSHVLAAMGAPQALAAGAIRISFGHLTGEREVECFLLAWRKCVASLGKDRQGIAA
jgi:cysteine desulfurase